MKPAPWRCATLSFMAGLACILGACSRSAPDLPAKSGTATAAPVTEQAVEAPTEAQVHALLMRAVYGNDYRADQGTALVRRPDADQPGAMYREVLEARTSTVLPGGETVLVVSGDVADDKGEARSGQAGGSSLNIYLLRETNGNWEVVRRHEHVAELGDHGRIGTTRWVRQTNGRVLLAVEDTSASQGYSVTGLALFDPAAENIRNLVSDGIVVRSDSEGACTDESRHCWKAEAKWHTAPSTGGAPYDDLVLVFSGYEEQAAADSVAEPESGTPDGSESTDLVKRTRVSLSGAARYAFDNGAYRLKVGKNPIPDA